MNLNIAICDDEQSYSTYIQEILIKWAECRGYMCRSTLFPSAEAFLFEYETNKSFDILLLDIEMKEISGIDLAKCIRKDNNRVEIIFITSHFEFYGEGYEVDALHYLIKPISEQKLCTVLDKAVEKLSAMPPYVIINSEGETVRLYESEILYIEAFSHYISIFTKEREYKVREKISAFETRLGACFYRTHRSYLVSLKHINRISRTSVWVEGGVQLPLSRGKYDDINYAFIKCN